MRENLKLAKRSRLASSDDDDEETAEIESVRFILSNRCMPSPAKSESPTKSESSNASTVTARQIMCTEEEV